MPVRPVDDKPSDTLVVVSGEGFWTGSSTLPHLHQLDRDNEASLHELGPWWCPANQMQTRPTNAGVRMPAGAASSTLLSRSPSIRIGRLASLIGADRAVGLAS